MLELDLRDRQPLGVAMVGSGFMGAAHSQAWRTAPRFFEMPLQPRLVAIAGRRPRAVQLAAAQYGWEESVTDWRALLDRDDIDVIDICAPGDLHEQIAVAALESGKHVLCEKPLANTVAQAQNMVAAAARVRAAGTRAAVGFSYRCVPAMTFAHRLVRDGRIGQVQQVRAQYLQDWLVDELVPFSWRLDGAAAGSGALGDIGAHIIDIAQFVTGERMTAVSGLLRTFVTERAEPIAGSPALGGRSAAGASTVAVTVDDAAIFSGELSGGATAVMEASRVATGRKNTLRLEVSGTRGAIAFDYNDSSALQLYSSDDVETESGFRRILVSGPGHPYADAWWPVGHDLGYEHGFAHEVADFVNDLADGGERAAGFDDGLAVQRVLDAVQRSAAAHSAWTETGLRTTPTPLKPLLAAPTAAGPSLSSIPNRKDTAR